MAPQKRQKTQSVCAEFPHFYRFQREAFVTLNPEGDCLALSPNWPHLSGHSLKKSLGKHFVPLLRECDQRKFLAFLTAPNTEKKLRFRLHHAEGHWEWFEVAETTTDTAKNEITLLLHRITDDIQRDHHLQKAIQETELALRGQSEFFAHISHELRTPLNAILGFTQMMQQGTFGKISNPRYRDYVQILESSGQELLSKINDLLEISSLSAGIDQLSEKNIPLPELMRSVIDIHARELFCRHIQIQADIPPLTIIGDRVKLQQALSHLLKNALKFSPEHSVIRLRASLREDGSLALLLRDQGDGFSEAQLAYFRDRAQQFSFLERNRKLLGFGLPLAEELVRLHDGDITCRNAPDGGAEVLLLLPASRVIAVKQERPTPSTARARPRASTESTKKLHPLPASLTQHLLPAPVF